MSSLFYFLTVFAEDLFSRKNIPFGILVVICLGFGLAEVAWNKRLMCVTAIGAVGCGGWMYWRFLV